MKKGAAAMGQSFRWFVVACAVMGVFSSAAVLTASGQVPLPREDASVAPWFMPLAEKVQGVDTSLADVSASGLISNVSAILAASPTAYYSGYAPGRVDAQEDGYVYSGNQAQNNPGYGTYGQYSVLYRWLVKDLSGYGAIVANLQPQDTMVMAAVVANVSSASVERLRGRTLSGAEYAGFLQGVTADFSANSSGGTLFPTYTAVYPSSATGVSTNVKDSTLVVFFWDGSQTSDSLVVPATPTSTNDNGFRALVQIVGARNAYSNYVGFDVDGPALNYTLSGAPDVAITTDTVDARNNRVEGWLRQTGHTTLITNASSEIRGWDTITVDAAFTTNAALDGEPNVYFGANNDYLVDAYNPTYLPLGSADVQSTSVDGNFAAAILRQDNDVDVPAWSTTFRSAVSGSTPDAPPVSKGEAGVWLGSRSLGGNSVSVANTTWNAAQIVMRATFVVSNASTVANANNALDSGDNAMPINFIVGDELGLSNSGQYSLGVGAGWQPLKFKAPSIANISNGTIAQVTGYVDNRPPVIIRSVLSANEHPRLGPSSITGEGEKGTAFAHGIVGPSTAADSIGLQMDISLEEDPQDHLKNFEITIATDTTNVVTIHDASKIWSVEDLASNLIWGISATTFLNAGTDYGVASANAGAIVKVTDDARNCWTFNSRDPNPDGNQWTVMGVAGTPKESTLVVDTAAPQIKGATLYVTQNVVGTEGISGQGTSSEGPAIGNTEVINLLKLAGSDAVGPDGATILGATIGSALSKFQILIQFDPDKDSDTSVDQLLATYPDDAAHADLRTQFDYSKPDSSNVLGINLANGTGLFDVDVYVPALDMTPSDFTVVESASVGTYHAGEATVILEGSVPASVAQLTSATGIAYVTAEVTVHDSVENYDYLRGNDNDGLYNGAGGRNQALVSGIVVDTTFPTILHLENGDFAASTATVQSTSVGGMLFAANSSESILNASWNNETGLGLNPHTTIRTAMRPPQSSGNVEVVAGDWLIVEASISGVAPTLVGGVAPSSATAMWPDTPELLDNVPYVITADFSDFISTATAVLPLASRTVSWNSGLVEANPEITFATAGDAILVTFGIRVTGDNLVQSTNMVRSVTLNIWDVAGNVCAVGLYGATADFGAPTVTVTGFELNGVDASVVVPATAGMGDRLDVFATVSTAAGGAKVKTIYGNFSDFGLSVFTHDQSAAGPPVYDATVSYIDESGALQSTAAADLSGTPITSGSPIYVTFTYMNFQDTGAAIDTAGAKVTIGATNTSNVAADDDTVSIGYDFNAPLITSSNLEQIAPSIAAGDSLTDNQVRPGDKMRAVIQIETDVSDRQGQSGAGSDASLISITPLADFSEFGASSSQAPDEVGWNGGATVDNILYATWTFTVGTPSGTGLVGPFSVDFSAEDAVGNSDTDNNVGSFFVENGAPLFANTDIIVRASQAINLVGGYTGTQHAFYELPGQQSGAEWTRSATETLRAGDMLHVTATISLNDDPAKVQINDNDLRLYVPSIEPSQSYLTPAWRVGSSGITARWETTVEGSAPSYRPAGDYSTEQQIKITATDTAGLSTTVVDDATVEIDNTPPVISMTQKFYVSSGSSGPNVGADRTNDVVTGKDGAAVLAGPATFTTIITADYSGALNNHRPAEAIAASASPNLVPGTLVGLDETDLGAGLPEPDLFTITGNGPLVTSGSSAAELRASTNTTVKYYYYNYDGALMPTSMGQLGAYIAGGGDPADVAHSGYSVSAAAPSVVAGKVIGYASDDVGNTTPTASIAAGGDATYASIFGVEVDNTAPSLTAYTDRFGFVKYATMQIVTTDNVNFDPTKPRVSAGDVVLVTFAVSDPTNNTTPLSVGFDMTGFIDTANDSPSFTNLWVENSPNVVGTYYAGWYEITGIEPSAADNPAEGHFEFTVGSQTTNSISSVDGSWNNAIPGALLTLDATDAIGLNVDEHGGGAVQSATIEVDNQAPIFVAKTVKLPDGSAINAQLTSDKQDAMTDVHVAVKQPGDTAFQVLDPPSVNNISQDPASPTLIRASATVWSDSVPSFTTDMLTKFNVGNTRLTNLTTSITAGAARTWTLNATAEVDPSAQPIQPQKITFTVEDDLGNASTSSDSNVLGINAQGVFLLESKLYVNGVDVSEGGQGGAAQTGSNAADRQLSGAQNSLDELRPGDRITFVATFANDSGAPDVLTADFSAFYPPFLKDKVTYMVPSATEAGSGNTTIATWEVATVRVPTGYANAGNYFASIWITAATPLGNHATLPGGRQGIGLSLESGALVVTPMTAALAPAGFGQDVLGGGYIAVQNVWNMNDMGNLTASQRLTQATGTLPNVAAKITLAATDYDSLFPATVIPSNGLIVDTQPPEVDVTLTPTSPSTFRTAGDGHAFNRVTAGDQVMVSVDVTNPNVTDTGDDDWAGGLSSPLIVADLSDLGLSGAQALTVREMQPQAGAPTVVKASDVFTVGDSVGTTDTGQQTVVDVVISASDDVGNQAVEVLHEQAIAVDNYPPSVFRGSLGVVLRDGTASYGTAPNITTVTATLGGAGVKLSSGWNISPGSILRVSAVIGDTLDDPLGFLSPSRISLRTSGISGATVELVTQEAVISLTNAAVPFDVTLPPKESLDTTLDFGFTVSVTDVLGNAKVEPAIGQFNVDGRPILETVASTDNGRLANQSVQDGDTLSINADEILTMEVTASDLGTISSLDITQTPDPASGSTVSVAKSAMDTSDVTATVTVTPDAPTYGVGPSDALNLKPAATDNTGLVAQLTQGIGVNVNDIALFRPSFDATIDTATATLSSDDIGRLSAAGADVREVTVAEGSLLTVTLEARDMTPSDALTLEVTGTAISSSATIAGATLNGVDVLDAATSPTVAIVESGSIAFQFEPGYEAIPYGAAVDEASFTLRAWVADDDQINDQTQKDYVDLLIHVTPLATAPVVTITDVKIINSDGLTSTSLGAVAAANVQETSTVVITVSGSDLGGEPVTLAFANDSTIADTRDVGTPTAGAATIGTITMTIGLFDADTGVGGGFIDSANDPAEITVTATNASSLSGSAVVDLDLLNRSMPPILTIASEQGGADLGDSIDVSAAEVSEVKLYITAEDSDGQLVIVDVDGTPLSDSVTIAGKSTGTYTYVLPTDLIQNTAVDLTVNGTDGGFQTTVRTFTINILVGNQAPTLAVAPTEATVEVGGSVVINATATDADSDAVTFTSSVTPDTAGTVVQGEKTQVGTDTSVAFTFTAGSTEGAGQLAITASDPSGASDTASVTITVQPAATPTPVIPSASPEQMLISQGWGGKTSSKRLYQTDEGTWRYVQNSGFQGLTKVYAENIINTTRARSVNTAVGDIDMDGVADIVTAFGPGGKNGDDGNPTTQPSVIVAWKMHNDSKPTKIRTKGVYSRSASAILNNLQGQVNVAVGNFVGEATPMIMCAQGVGGKNRVRALQYGWSSTAGKFVLNDEGTFKALSADALWGNTSGGVVLAAGDVDGDGLDELVVGQMNGEESGGFQPQTYIQVLDLVRDATSGEVIVENFGTPVQAMPSDKQGLGGVNLTVGDLRGDGTNLIVVSSAGNPDGTTKNQIRVFALQDGSLTPVTGPLVALGASQNPSGALSIAAGNLDDDAADELLIGAQAIISVDLDTGKVTFTNAPPASKVKGIKLNFNADGSFAPPLQTARIPFSPYGSKNAPWSNAVNVGFYPTQ